MFIPARPRAIIGRIGADTPDAAALLRQISAGFNEFRDASNERIANMEAALNATLNSNTRGIGPGPIGNVIPDNVRAQFRAALQGSVQASMELGSGPDGGYTVPAQIDSTIMGLLLQTSALRSMATVVTLPTGVGSWKKLVTRTGSGILWAHELETRQETSTPKLGVVEIMPEELYAIPEVTNHILDDSAFNLDAFLRDEVAAEFALGENLAFVSGDGVKKPLGLLAAPITNEADNVRAFGSYQYVPTGAAGDFGAQFQDNLIDLVFKLPAAYRSGDGVGWFMNSMTASRVMKFKDTTGRLLWRDGLTAGEPPRLLGYPVMIDEAMPDIAANALAIAFGNWKRGYAIVDRPGMKLLRDPLTKKGWTKFYFSKRVGGAPLDTNAIKFLKFSVA